MRSCRICLLLLSAALSYTASAQQEPTPNLKKTDTQAANINLPVKPTENWGTPADTKTGLEPLSPAIVQKDDKPEFVRELLRLQWRANDPIEVWLIRPKVAGKVPEKVPVILYLYGYPDTAERFRDDGWCKRATADGFAAVGFVGALTDYRFKDRPLKQWFVSELAESLGSTTHDVLLLLNHLSQRGDLDVNHVGVFGMGSGGTIAILAAQADSRITTLDLLDPWGDWPNWLKNSPVVPQEERPKYLTKEFLHSVSSLDPVSYFPTLKTPSIRLQQMLNEPVTPPAAKETIAAAAPLRTTLVKYQTAEDLLKSWQVAGLSGWIKQQLRSQKPKSNTDEGHVAKNE
jgi:cephalosporin-C deacetylase-like acetyl esterase